MLYHAPYWLPGGHLQTIIPATLFRKPQVTFRRERWNTPDNDFIDVDFVEGASDQPCVVLFHGLEGSSDSHYARALMAQISELGWSGAVPHFRGCSGTMNHAPRFYHSGDAAEVGWIMQRFKERAVGRPLFAVGVSLGGNALLRWLGESQHQADFVQAACAVSAPLDLTAGGAALSHGVNMLYTRHFLRTLKPKCELKLQQHPGLFDAQAMRNARNLYEFDNVVTAPLHGYRDTDDYWSRASARHVLPDITVPTLVLNAQNDPFLPARHLPRVASKNVTLEFPLYGGHVGFTERSNHKGTWLPNRIIRFMQGIK